MMLVIHDLKILELVLEHGWRAAREQQLRQRERNARELLVDLFEMVRIEMAVAARPDELAHVEITLLRDHVSEQRIRGDIERDAEENVRAALVELTTQAFVRHIELEEGMAGHELHLVELAHVPGTHDDASGIRIRAQLLHDLRNLVDLAAIRCWP